MNTTGIPAQNLLDNSVSKTEKKSNSKKSSKADFNDLLKSPDKKDKSKESRANKGNLASTTSNKKSNNYESNSTNNYDSRPVRNESATPRKEPIANKPEIENVAAKKKPVVVNVKSVNGQIPNQHIENKLNEVKAQNNPTTDLSQRLAMQNFLLKMKKELDVHSEQLIQAFSTMSVEELMSPPEESVGQLLSSLDLSPEQNEKAQLYFHEMLKQTASSSMADYLKENNSDLSIQVLSKKELQNNKMQKAISDMSNSFFVSGKEQQNQMAKGVVATAGIAGAHEALNQQSQQAQVGVNEKNAFFDVNNRTDVSGELPNLGGKAGVDISEMQAVSKGEAASMEKLLNKESLAPTVNSQPTLDEAVREVVSSKDLGINTSTAKESGFLENLNLGLTANSSSQSKEFLAENSGGQIDSSTSAEGADILGMATNNKADSGDGKNSGEGSSDNPDMMYSQVKVDNGNSAQQKEFVINTKPQATDIEEAANVKEVVNQARLMVKKGGGEMKVQMTPHGLGEVTMKVNVENGNVNVEMLADTADAKKILEKGLSELKATLASHKLNVENIKVDTSSNLMGDLTEKQDEAERQFAQQFMGEFRRNNQSWRNGFYGISGARAYSSQTQDEAENPLLQVNNNKRPTRSEKRLDLVA